MKGNHTVRNNNSDLDIDCKNCEVFLLSGNYIQSEKEWEYPLMKKEKSSKDDNMKNQRKKLNKSACSKSKRDLGLDFKEFQNQKLRKITK